MQKCTEQESDQRTHDGAAERPVQPATARRLSISANERWRAMIVERSSAKRCANRRSRISLPVGSGRCVRSRHVCGSRSARPPEAIAVSRMTVLDRVGRHHS
jgi:hypothetical protein